MNRSSIYSATWPKTAPRSVLDHAEAAIETEDVEVRVAAVEQAADLAKRSGEY
jgi:hypothetical protein